MAAKRKGKNRKLKHGTAPKAKARGAVRLAPEPWDRGADGPAARNRESEVVEGIDPEVDPDTNEVKRRNPNGVKRLRYLDMLETYHKRGIISARGMRAGERLRDAWATTQRSAGNNFSQDKVDSSPKPDAQAAINADRMTAYIRITQHIPTADHALLMAVVCEGHSISALPEYRAGRIDRGKAHLRAALDRLADKLRC